MSINIGHLIIFVEDSRAPGTWHVYWDSEIDQICRSNVAPGAVQIRSFYYGRGTRNHPEGVCFSSPGMYSNHLTAVRMFKRFRFVLNEAVVGEIQIPINADWVNQAGLEPYMRFPESLILGPIEIFGITLRDIRSTLDHEMSALHLRVREI